MANNVNISTKSTGQQHTAAELNLQVGWMNEPSQNLGTYSGSAITIDGTGRYSRYVMSGNLAIPFATSGHKENNAVLLPITSDGSTLTFTANLNYDIYLDNSLTNGGALASGEYLFVFAFIDGAIEVGYKTSTKIDATADTTPPTFSAGPSSANVAETSFDITATLNENGTVYAVVVADGATAPTSSEVKAGTGSGGGGQLATDSASDSGSGVTLNLTGLNGSTSYDVYVVAEDSMPNLQANPTLVNVTTTAGDVTAPQATFSPLNGATDVAIDSNIIITFNEAILNTNGTEVTDGNVASLITLKEDNISGADIAFSATINVGKTEITINPTSDLANSQDVFVQVNNFEDAAGNEETSGQSATFTTAAPSLIVMQDDFAGTTIDSGKWIETDPADGVTITQNNELIFTLDRTSPVASSNTNRVDTVDSITNGCFQFTPGGTAEWEDGTLSFGLSESHGTDALAQVICINGGSSTDTGVRLRFWDSGVSYDTDIGSGTDQFFTTWRIRYDSSTTTVYIDELTAPNTWTNRASRVFNLGTNLTARIGANCNAGSGTIAYTVNNVYLTNDTYLTSTPT